MKAGYEVRSVSGCVWVCVGGGGWVCGVCVGVGVGGCVGCVWVGVVVGGVSPSHPFDVFRQNP